MQRKDVLTLVIAIGSGFFAFVLVMNVMNKPARIGERFVAAARDITKDEVLDENAVVMSELMTGKERTTLFLQVPDVISMKVLEAVKQGELILRSKVKPYIRDEVAEALAELPEGMRAMTISAASVDPMPELLRVGSFVDILGKVQIPGRPTEARMLYRSAKVISVKKSEAESEFLTITAALDSRGAEVVSKALLQGKLGLIVRGGEGTGADTGVVEGLEEAPNKPVLEEAISMEIIRGVDKVMIKTNEKSAGAAAASGQDKLPMEDNT